MTRKVIVFLVLSVLVCFDVRAMDCEIGPLDRRYGGTEWYVYACSDHKSVVIVSKPESPAMPYIFTIVRKDGEFVIQGEGSGDKSAAAAAAADLEKLNKEDFYELITEASSM